MKSDIRTREDLRAIVQMKLIELNHERFIETDNLSKQCDVFQAISEGEMMLKADTDVPLQVLKIWIMESEMLLMSYNKRKKAI